MDDRGIKHRHLSTFNGIVGQKVDQMLVREYLGIGSKTCSPNITYIIRIVYEMLSNKG